MTCTTKQCSAELFASLKMRCWAKSKNFPLPKTENSFEGLLFLPPWKIGHPSQRHKYKGTWWGSTERCKNSSHTENGPVEQKRITFNVRSAKFKPGMVFDFHRPHHRAIWSLMDLLSPPVSHHSGWIKNSLVEFLLWYHLDNHQDWMMNKCTVGSFSCLYNSFYKQGL